MRLRAQPGVLMPVCPYCHGEIDKITVIQRTQEFVPICERCHAGFAGHPIQEFLRKNPDALVAETWGELTRSTDVMPFRRMLDSLMLTPARFDAFIERETKARRGDPASPGAGHDVDR